MILSYDPLTESQPDPFLHPSPLNQAPGARQKLALVGFEEKNGQTAPLDDPTWDVAGLNMGNRMGIHADSQGQFRADVWFDLHEEHAQDERDMAWITRCPLPIYLTHDFGGNALRRLYSVEAVLEEILDRTGTQPARYFASSFAYIVAWGLARGYSTIGLFGINLGWGREQIVERGNLEYWIGLAQGLGVTVICSPKTKLLTHPALYGFEYTKEKTGVERLCGEVMRQLLQSPDMKDQFDETLTRRTDMMASLAEQIQYSVAQLLFANPGDSADDTTGCTEGRNPIDVGAE